MKRMTLAVSVFIALLAFTAPLVLAGNDPEPPPGGPSGGCSGSDCR